jgi:hypothetical protein
MPGGSRAGLETRPPCGGLFGLSPTFVQAHDPVSGLYGCRPVCSRDGGFPFDQPLVAGQGQRFGLRELFLAGQDLAQQALGPVPSLVVWPRFLVRRQGFTGERLRLGVLVLTLVGVHQAKHARQGIRVIVAQRTAAAGQCLVEHGLGLLIFALSQVQHTEVVHARQRDRMLRSLDSPPSRHESAVPAS